MLLIGYFGVLSDVICFNVTSWESFTCMFSVCNYIFGGGLFTTFADFIGKLSLCFTET